MGGQKNTKNVGHHLCTFPYDKFDIKSNLDNSKILNFNFNDIN